MSVLRFLFGFECSRFQFFPLGGSDFSCSGSKMFQSLTASFLWFVVWLVQGGLANMQDDIRSKMRNLQNVSFQKAGLESLSNAQLPCRIKVLCPNAVQGHKTCMYPILQPS